jgi:pimeloyl-ACP methyl ester carboxylesterase
MHEVVLPTDRWSARAISPFDITQGINTDKYGEVVLVHPGWAKAPERHRHLLLKLAEHGFLPIGVDTRYAYSDRLSPRKSIVAQPFKVGKSNPFFEGSTTVDNRWRYRRPTVLLDICARLEIQRRSYVGHSDGGRIGVLAAVANPADVDNLVVINGAGTGSSSSGGRRFAKSNLSRVIELGNNISEIPEATSSAIGSAVYALTHFRRTFAEKQTIQATNTWAELDKLEHADIGVTVMHAVSDELISFDDSQLAAESRPWVNFTKLDGGHSNVYEPAVHDHIIQALQQR